MAEIKNTFLKGKMNQDLDARILPNGEYREARNLAISRSEGSSVGEFENVLGNISISSLNAIIPGGEDEFIGYVVDNNANVAYLMATDWKPISSTQPNGIDTRAPSTGDGSNQFIIKVDLSSINTPPVVLVQGSFLNFNQNYIITGINLIEDQLFWTDNLNQPRKINITKALANPNHYTNEDQISVAKFAPWEPILVMDRATTTITGASGGASVITPSSLTGIEVGDIVTNNNKIDTQNISNLVTVIGINSPTLSLSSAITVPDGTSIDFSRPTMTNKKDSVMANHSSGPIISVTNPGSISAVYEYGDALLSGTDPDFFLYNGNNGIPKIGDLVSGPTVPGNTRVASVSVIDQTNGVATPSYSQVIKITLNKVTSLIATDTISVSDNPDYNVNWQGDEKFLEDKFVRFSYRFKFEDNEYSLMAPFSQVMFIPKQYSQFGSGKVSTTEDMNDAYKSTVLTWFENNINNILLKIPMEKSSAVNMIDLLKITDIDILYKESDALAVKVLETITLSDQTFSTISFNDAIHGNATKHFLNYDYTSSKPYKTLPSNQITRVSDKVPVKALAQEVIGNRIVYGNYLDRHTGPNSIAFEAKAVNKSTRFDNYTQFPKHQLKQDRTYQVGFVLSDRYGRQSDVILSSYDSGGDISGSTVFNAYNNLTEQTNSPIVDWLGNALNVTLNEAIQSTYNPSLGTPGIYSSSNPLGWFSYKVVVKQTEQEYYNAYLPGFVNGYPVQENSGTERNKSFFTTLLGDNINKIPRNLVEVGASDRDFTSSEDILIRVNNPNIVNKPPAGLFYDQPYNTQYYPGNIEQEIIQISTVRDMEIAAIPFKPNVNGGEYGKSGITNIYNYDDPANPQRVTSVNDTPEQIGAIPWGKTGPDASLYNTDSNLFVVRGNQSENINNPVGAIVTAKSINTDPTPVGTLSMVPFLSVAETKPVESLLDIYWETSLSGSIVALNNIIDSQYGGLIGSNFQATTFPESATDTTVIGSAFNFTDGSGNLVPPANVTIVDWSIIDGNGTVISADTFNIAIDSLTTPTGFQIKPGTGKTFFYNSTVDLGFTGVYTITVNTSYTTGAGTFTDSTVLPNISLSNVAPTIDSFTQPSNITTASGQTIIDLSAVNGSADATVNTQELVWSLEPERLDFSIDSSTGVITSTNNLAINTDYNIDVVVQDLNGSGLTSAVSTVSFTTGAQRINKALCEGWQTGFTTECNQSMQLQFLASSTVSGSSIDTVDDDGVPGGTSVTYPGNSSSRTYNVFARNPSTTTGIPPVTVNHTTGALTQGTLYIEPVLTNNGATIAGDVTVSYTIQEKSGTGFIQATDSNGFPIYNLSVSTSENSATTGSRTEISKPGEYRVITTALAGTLCVPAGGTSNLIFNFGDAVYSNCSTAPA